MSHGNQMDFIGRTVAAHPFKAGARVLEIGSYDVNGSARKFFPGTAYTGIDLCPGKAVDIVASGDTFKDPKGEGYDVIVCAESFEHNPKWQETWQNMLENLLKPGGLAIMTCAGIGREEHGTNRTTPKESLSSQVYPDYYRNLTPENFIRAWADFSHWFGVSHWETHRDEVFWYGVKNTEYRKFVKIPGASDVRVAWVTPYTVDKLWDPALRLRRTRVWEQLRLMGVDTLFIYGSEELGDSELESQLSQCDAVVFTEQSERDYRLMCALKAKGVVLLRDHCENIFGFPWQHACFEAADLVVCASSFIAEMTAARGYKTCVIPDMWEAVPLQKVRFQDSGLKAVFMGTGPGIKMLQGDYGRAVRDAGFEIKQITNDPQAGPLWSRDTWRSDFMGADVALCPQDIWSFPGKSQVKVAQALAAGYPVVASPLRSYIEALEGDVGYIVYSPEQWGEAMRALRDPLTRLRLHQKSVERAAMYSPERISRMWYCRIVEQCYLKRSWYA
jgi:glycosyltransferase involved in cell wall biosynthesis